MVDEVFDYEREELPPSLAANLPVEDEAVEADDNTSQKDEASSDQYEQYVADRKQALTTGRPVVRAAREGFGGEYMGGYTPAPKGR